MLGKTTYPAQIGRACQHKDTITLSYRSASEKSTQVLTAGGHLCGACADLVKELLDQGGPAAAVVMPDIQGSPGQVRWASTLRAKAAAKLTPVIGSTLNDPRPTAVAVHHACRLMLSVRRAGFWIDNKDCAITASWLQGQAAALFLGRLPSKDPRRQFSPLHELLDGPQACIAEQAVAEVRRALQREREAPSPPPPPADIEFDFGF